VLDGVSILPALDDQPGIAVLDGRAFEARERTVSPRFTRATRSAISARSVILLAQAGLAHVAERRRRAGFVALLGGHGSIKSRGPGISFQFGRTSMRSIRKDCYSGWPQGPCFELLGRTHGRACVRLSPPLLWFVSATFCEAIELRRNVSALVELDWLSGVVSDANQLPAQGLNRLNVLHVNAKGTGLG
jgi:hypothetical protein